MIRQERISLVEHGAEASFRGDALQLLTAFIPVLPHLPT